MTSAPSPIPPQHHTGAFGFLRTTQLHQWHQWLFPSLLIHAVMVQGTCSTPHSGSATPDLLESHYCPPPGSIVKSWKACCIRHHVKTKRDHRLQGKNILNKENRMDYMEKVSIYEGVHNICFRKFSAGVKVLLRLPLEKPAGVDELFLHSHPLLPTMPDQMPIHLQTWSRKLRAADVAAFWKPAGSWVFELLAKNSCGEGH